MWCIPVYTPNPCFDDYLGPPPKPVARYIPYRAPIIESWKEPFEGTLQIFRVRQVPGFESLDM